MWEWLNAHHPEHIDNFNIVTILDMTSLNVLADMHRAGKLPADAETIQPHTKGRLGHLEARYLELVNIDDKKRMTGITITKHGIAFTDAVKAAIKQNEPTPQNKL